MGIERMSMEEFNEMPRGSADQLRTYLNGRRERGDLNRAVEVFGGQLADYLDRTSDRGTLPQGYVTLLATLGMDLERGKDGFLDQPMSETVTGLYTTEVYGYFTQEALAWCGEAFGPEFAEKVDEFLELVESMKESAEEIGEDEA